MKPEFFDIAQPDCRSDEACPCESLAATPKATDISFAVYELAFLTMSCDLEMVRRLTGVDYEWLDHSAQETLRRGLNQRRSFWPGDSNRKALKGHRPPNAAFATGRLDRMKTKEDRGSNMQDTPPTRLRRRSDL